MDDIEQEIEWLKEEIGQDEEVLKSGDGTYFHRERLAENRVKLEELEL